jgi:hypothetical protein
MRAAKSIRALLHEAPQEAPSHTGRLSPTTCLTEAEQEMADILVRIARIEDDMLE